MMTMMMMVMYPLTLHIGQDYPAVATAVEAAAAGEAASPPRPITHLWE
jgi:hypothetical protein